MPYLTNNYAPLNVSFTRGLGCYLFDKNNEKYLDCLAGVGVLNLGHSHPKIVKIICHQAQQLIHTSNLYQIENQQKLAKKICTLAKMDKVFFANSGAEANEAAIKITRLFAQKNNIKNPIILTMNKSFHGRTMTTLSATGNQKIQQGFTPLVANFIYVDFDNIEQIKQHTTNNNIVAIMLEPILGESGIIIPKKNYLNKVRVICNQNNWLMILDEVQTGIGRTGKMFAFEYNNITPDILTLAKGLGNGLPIGACVTKGIASELFTPGTHGSTFGGNPLVCSVANTVLDIIKEDKILENVIKISQYFTICLKNIKSLNIKQIRIQGLMIGIELTKDPIKLLNLALQNKLLINITGNTIRLLPPLVLRKKEVDITITKLTKLINSL